MNCVRVIMCFIISFYFKLYSQCSEALVIIYFLCFGDYETLYACIVYDIHSVN